MTRTKLENEVLNMYDDIKIPCNDVCLKCRSEKDKKGLKIQFFCGIWQVGKEWDNKSFFPRILFVGKTARGDFSNGTSLDVQYNFPIWKYMQKITLDLFKAEKGPQWSAEKAHNWWEYIAFTNFVKCNGGSTADATTEAMREKCAMENEVLLKEMKIIQPTHVVFLVGQEYEKSVRKMFGFDKWDVEKEKDVTKNQNSKRHSFVPFKLKKGFYYDKENTKEKINILLTGHPERKCKEKFCQMVLDAIK